MYIIYNKIPQAWSNGLGFPSCCSSSQPEDSSSLELWWLGLGGFLMPKVSNGAGDVGCHNKPTSWDVQEESEETWGKFWQNSTGVD